MWVIFHNFVFNNSYEIDSCAKSGIRDLDVLNLLSVISGYSQEGNTLNTHSPDSPDTKEWVIQLCLNNFVAVIDRKHHIVKRTNLNHQTIEHLQS